MKLSHYVSIVIAMTLISAGVAAQTDGSYGEEWKRVDSLRSIGQPRSALDLVKGINERAFREQNGPQFLQSVLIRVRLTSEFEEDFFEKSIRDLQQDLVRSKEPATSILHSVLAELYWKYYTQNQFRIRSRSYAAVTVSDSLSTWDLKTIAVAITNEYLLSLQNDSLLKSVPASSYEAILEFPDTGEPGLKKENPQQPYFYRPTLYDFLAHRALDFFSASRYSSVKIPETFFMDSPDYFAPTGVFIRLAGPAGLLPDPLDHPRTLRFGEISPTWIAFRIFQSLAAFHSGNNDPTALLDAEIQRLNFVYEKSTLITRDSLYIFALKSLEDTYRSFPGGTAASCALASFLNDQGSKYQPLVSDRYRYDKKAALDICENAIGRFPSSPGAGNCSILRNAILEKNIRVTTESAVPPEKSSLALLGFRNIGQVSFRLIPVDPETYATKTAGMNREEQAAFLKSLPFRKEWKIVIPETGDYQEHTMEIPVPEVSPGYYMLLASGNSGGKTDSVFSFSPLWVTRISYISQRQHDGSYGVYLLDRSEGTPLPGASAELMVRKYDSRNRKYQTEALGNILPDKNGFLSVRHRDNMDRYGNVYLRISLGSERYITDPLYVYKYEEPKAQKYTETRFFTDRSVYRPGQSIWFKGIMLDREGDRTSLAVNRETEVTLLDVNGRKVASQKFITNEFGSFHGSFTAPSGVLNGEMILTGTGGSTSVSVEEYKRPTFYAGFDPVEGQYRAGEKISLSGSVLGYTGDAVAESPVIYRIVRQARFPYWDRWYIPFPVSDETEIAHGSTITDSAGRFRITFPAIPDLSVDPATRPVFDYHIMVDVTGPGGETRSARQILSVGYNALFIDAAIPEKLNIRKDTLHTIRALNVSGLTVPTGITAILERIAEPDRVFKPRYWPRPDMNFLNRSDFYRRYPYDIYAGDDDPLSRPRNLISTRILMTGVDSVYRTGQLKPGSYLLTLTAKDDFGQEVIRKILFTAFDPGSRQMPVRTIDWFVALKADALPGEEALFLLGSTESNIHVIREIRAREGLVASSTEKTGDRVSAFRIMTLPEYRGNFSVNFVFVKHNRVFQHTQTVLVPYEDKTLDVTIQTFRNRLEPGEQEEWTITVKDPLGKPVGAEFLCSMYDASLDIFRATEWNFDIYARYYASLPWDISDAFSISSGSGSRYRVIPARYDFPVYYRLNWFGLYLPTGYGYRDRYKQAKEMPVMMQSEGGAVPESADAGPERAGKPDNTLQDSVTEKKATVTDLFPVRRDFRETAFFYPSLHTDSSGTIKLLFTAPEALTRWKITGLAHTKDLRYGMIHKVLVTRRDLMVFPNAPRFLRQGDTLVFKTRIVNMSDTAIRCTVTLELADPLNDGSLNDLIRDHTGREVILERGGNTSVSWTLVIPYKADLQMIRYRVEARSENFHDAEERIIPVLTNRMLVTETMPMAVRGMGETSFSFDKLLQSPAGREATLKNYRLTLEFTTNPAWYAIQALPSLNDKTFRSADAIFAAYYSNAIAAHIMNSDASVREVFESWKNLTPDALLSELESNQDLKSVLLQETPWVTEAARETERRRKLGQYFDANNLSQNLAQNLEKLRQLQLPSGGWSWFERMPESRWVTQQILTGLGHLDHLGIGKIRDEEITWAMIVKAIAYLDQELARDLEQIKKFKPFKETDMHLSPLQVQYLYARSFFMDNPNLDRPLGEKVISSIPEAFQFFLDQASRHWVRQDLYQQGMIALALYRLGDQQIPPLILRSLAEKSIRSDELGMYWARRGDWHWYQAPVETQALMIEAFDEILNDARSVEEMKVWLLKQKQTQQWRSPRATVEAVYALLLRGTGLLKANDKVTITVGDKTLDPSMLTDLNTEAGTGYFRITWSGNEIKPEMGKVVIRKQGEGLSWGALYWQYFENIDQITPAATPLSVRKEIFVEQQAPAGIILIPLAPYKSENMNDTLHRPYLKPGDKLKVRTILSTDRDMEFIHLKDMHAAGLDYLYGPQDFPAGEENLSGYRYQDGLGYYQNMTDPAAHFFIEYLPRGTYVFEYPLVVTAAGDFSNGITTIQCLYAPEFSSHTEGQRLVIKR